MRVVLLGPYPPPYGGVQIHLVALRGFLHRHGIGTAVINLTRHTRVEGDDIYYPRTAREVIRLLQQLQYDICHLHFGGNLTFRLLGLVYFCTLMPGRKTVLTLHSGGFPFAASGASGFTRHLRGAVFGRIDGIIGVNPEIVDLFLDHGVAPSRVRLIAPHAVDVGGQSAPLQDPLHSFFLAHRPVLVTVGLLEPEYDLPLQVGMLGELRRSWLQAGLVILGSGSLESQLRQLIASTGYAEHVLLCGDVPHEETLCAIANGDVLLRTTWYDGDSIAVREALALGTPVVATDNGMRPEGVMLIPARDAGALYAATVAQLGKGSSGKHIVAPERQEENLRKVLSFYRELVGGVRP